MNRYLKNGIFTDQEKAMIYDAHVCIIGCGGLGGYVLEMLSRMGVGTITIVDPDTFDVTNLNRQLISDEHVLGSSKVKIGKHRISKVNSEVEVIAIEDFMNADNVDTIIQGASVVVDALDDIESRFTLFDSCRRENIPMVYGAIAGWYGQVSTIFPEDDTLHKIYKKHKKGVESLIGNPSFTPATIASCQVSEVLKVLTGKGSLLRNQVMHIDLLDNEMHTIEF